MKKIPLILALLLALMTGSAWGAKVIYVSDAAADTVGIGGNRAIGSYTTTYWTSHFTGALDTLAATGDSISVLDDITETGTQDIGIASINTLKVNGNGHTVSLAFTGDNLTFSSTTGWIVTNIGWWIPSDYAGGTWVWNNVDFQPPAATFTAPASGVLMNLYNTTGTHTFTDCTFTPDLVNQAAIVNALKIDVASVQTLSFRNCTWATGFGITTAAVAGAHKIDFRGCTIHSKLSFNALTAAQRLRLDSCTVSGGLVSTGKVDSLFATGTSFTAWDEVSDIAYGLRSSPKWYGLDSLVFTPTTCDCASWYGVWIENPGAGKMRGSYVTDCTVAANADNDDTLDAFRIQARHDSVTVARNTFYSGALYTYNANADSAAGRWWTIEDNVIDHDSTHYAGLYGMMLCIKHSLITGNTIKSQAGHLLGIMDDGTAEYIGNDTLMVYQNVVEDNILTSYLNTHPTSGATQTSFVVSSKGAQNKVRNNTLKQYGSAEGISKVVSLGGQADSVYNNDIWAAIGGEGVHSIIDDLSWYTVNGADNWFGNNRVTGAAEYVVQSSSGDGSGWSESNNCWALAYSVRFDADGDSMVETSFRDTTSWRMDYGGKRDMTGIYGHFAPVGVQSSAADTMRTGPTVWFKPPAYSTSAQVIATPWHLLSYINDGSLPASDSLKAHTWFVLPTPTTTWEEWQIRTWLDAYNAWPEATRKKIRWRIGSPGSLLVYSGDEPYVGPWGALAAVLADGEMADDSLDTSTWWRLPKPTTRGEEMQLLVYLDAYNLWPLAYREKIHWRIE